MKKIKLILALLVLMPFSRAFAQMGEIIYRDFDPDSCLHVHLSHEEMCFDLNFDGISDICMNYVLGTAIVGFEIVAKQDNLLLCISNNNDTIASAKDWRKGWDESYPEGFMYMGFRLEIDRDYYYGWFRTYAVLAERNWYFDKFAFCTIPNYPLRWGQTNLTDVEENEAHCIAKLHPNPTTGIVHIEDVECAEVQVYNTLGQLVKTLKNANEVSLEGLPQGVYLLRVTTADGRVFSEKVVKE